MIGAMIVSLLIFILLYSQPFHPSYHTFFVILMLLTINIINESSKILHQPHFHINTYYFLLLESSIVGHLIRVSFLN